MGDLEWMMGVIMLSSFSFAAIARFNLHRYLERKQCLATVVKTQEQVKHEKPCPEAIWNEGLNKLYRYIITGMVIFVGGSATLVDSGALNALVCIFTHEIS
ncbi:hypothetical protein FR932_06085 [Moritella marina ATCC 15381]|uniref:Uncharacterized protein n=1 Tax=Moritella marina ATCC 15381 TaxID=1202962 RepID=A0A5J6WK47_MORMI|nr:hypothetical protein [Moritella marina]QFI37430.1 hypothetical protein FR932_06085 [Moritella marina ATCC 15381]